MRAKLTHAFWARFLAFLLFLLTVLSAAGCSALVAMGVYEGWYYEEPRFNESWIYRDQLREDAVEIMQHCQFGTLKTSRFYLDAEDGNLFFVIRAAEGKQAYQDTRYAVGAANVTLADTFPFAWDSTDPETGRTFTTERVLELYLRNDLTGGDKYGAIRQVYLRLWSLRNAAIVCGVVSLLLAILLYVFLLCSAGHREGVEEPVLIRQDKIPLDLYLAVTAGLFLLLTWFLAEGIDTGRYPIILSVIGVCALGYAILFAACSMTLAARLKVGKWWQNTLVWRIFRFIFRLISRVFRAIPLASQAILGYLIFCILGAVLSFLVIDDGSFVSLLLLLALFVAGLALLCAAVFQMKALQTGVEALAGGRLDHKVITADLYGPFRRHGENLNRINEGISKAVEERMKSERFKTELITNVSHDIKTPLTSIINYIDLLKKEDLSGTRAAEYVEVLDRQSQRLKKLTEDVVEASKASAGVIPVHPDRTDAAELLEQALGEYGERLEQRGVTPVTAVPEDGAVILADGRLLWRVFENLLQNICRYAQPGTRAYFDVQHRNNTVEIVIKNISAAPLNISAEALMERFVRGDASRGSEGSGLGLSIARSLTELQGGTFDIQLDGDLFKVCLRFPTYRGGSTASAHAEADGTPQTAGRAGHAAPGGPQTL